jgi:hypothetical protein
MKSFLVVEVAIAPVHRQRRGGQARHNRTRGPLNSLIPLAGHDNDKLMSEARRGPQLRFNIGSNTPAFWGIERANIDNSHAAESGQ